jgi:hypothetical protein
MLVLAQGVEHAARFQPRATRGSSHGVDVDHADKSFFRSLAGGGAACASDIAD